MNVFKDLKKIVLKKMGFHFFTEVNKLQIQTKENAYGYVHTNGNLEEFNIQNQFLVEQNAPAFSVTKSLVFYQEDQSNTDLLNVVLFPLESNFTAGFPIKFFVYRGILKSSLVNQDKTIKTTDASWTENNILNLIKKNQDKINEKTGATNEATETSLGLHFRIQDSNILLETILFDFTDNFHPLIVSHGCEVGKFAGGDTPIGIGIVQDRIGEEIDLGFLRTSKSIISCDNTPISNTLSEKEKKKQLFIRRNRKERILGYMDITAFYGACFNQEYEIEGGGIDKDAFLATFYNSNTVYIDIRDERGFSFNHFLNFDDTLPVGFHNSTNELVYEPINYYDGWPILQLKNKEYQGNKNEFYIKLPILIGMPEVANILTTYTKKVGVHNNGAKKHTLLANQKVTGEVSLKESEPIKLENWSNAKQLASNYFLLKVDRIENENKEEALQKIWNSFFSLKMKNVFATENIPEGEYRVKTYSSINAPIDVNSNLSGYYSPTIGIVADKHHISFFSFYDELVYEESQKQNLVRSSFIQTGKYNNAFSSEGLVYEGDQAVGFLYQMVVNKLRRFELSQYNLTDTDNGITNSKFLLPQATNVNDYQEFMDNFDCITLTHEEYQQLLAKVNETIDDADYIQEHAYYIKGTNNKWYPYEQFNMLETTITLGLPKIDELQDGASSVIRMAEHPTVVKVNDEEIVLTSATAN